jgi:UDP-N-acetylmuramoylalanine-D-glutamate ligase
VRAVRGGGVEHFENPMKKICAQFDFPACKAEATLLQTDSETRRELFHGGVILVSPACSSVKDFSKHSQAGEFLLGLV